MRVNRYSYHFFYFGYKKIRKIEIKAVIRNIQYLFFQHGGTEKQRYTLENLYDNYKNV